MLITAARRRAARMAYHYRNHAARPAKARDGKRDMKRRVIEALGLEPKCQRCGYDKYLGALDFHHVDPTQKDPLFRRTNWGFDRVLDECGKCALLCANCHREIHGDDDSKGGKGGRPRRVDVELLAYMDSTRAPMEVIADYLAGCAP